MILDDVLTGTIDLYCYMILRGKPCACESIQERYFEKMGIRIKNVFGLKTYGEDLALGWKTIWIYKDDYMLEIIKLLPEQPKTIFEHWILGKAFGYSDEAIKEFLNIKA
jgi:hypothetical protein